MRLKWWAQRQAIDYRSQLLAYSMAKKTLPAPEGKLDYINNHVIPEETFCSLPHLRWLILKEKLLSKTCQTVSHATSESRYEHLGDMHKVVKRSAKRVYTDVFGPIKYQSLEESKLFVTLFDRYSGYSMVRFLGKHNEATEAFIEIIKELESLSNERVDKLTCTYWETVRWVISDGCGEYKGNSFQKRLEQKVNLPLIYNRIFSGVKWTGRATKSNIFG